MEEAKELGNKVHLLARRKGLRTAKKLYEVMPTLVGKQKEIGAVAQAIDNLIQGYIREFKDFKDFPMDIKITPECVESVEAARLHINENIYNEIAALLKLEKKVEEEVGAPSHR